MYHIHIAHAKKDRISAFLLSCRLKRYYQAHKQLGPVTVHTNGPLFSETPGDRNYLIVLCSFHTVNDPYIAEVITRFYEKEPLSHIVPYTISGIPCAHDPADECLPQVLSEITRNDLLAINSVVLSKHAAIQKVISTVHDIPLAELEQRNEKRRRHRILMTVLFCLAVFLYGSWSNYTVKTRSEYYRSFTYINGVPEGVDRLNFLERIGCKDYYLFQVHYQSVSSIQSIGNPEGARSADPQIQAFYDAIDTPCVQFVRHLDGTPDAAVHMDSAGNVLFVMNYCAGMDAADFSRHTDGIDPYFLTLDGKTTEWARCLFDYDDTGTLTAISYRTNSRNE